MRFLLDENLSPRLRGVLAGLGYDAICIRDSGRLGLPDHAVLAWAIEEDRIVVTANGDDFRQLVGREPLHPGLWILPNVTLQPATEFLHHALAFVFDQDEPPASYMVNRVLHIAADGVITVQELPPLD